MSKASESESREDEAREAAEDRDENAEHREADREEDREDDREHRGEGGGDREEDPDEAAKGREATARTRARQAADDKDDEDDEPAAAKPKKRRAASDEADDGSEVDDDVARVARALGVADDGEPSEEAAPEEEPKAPPNRAARRREEAIERRRKRRGAAGAKADDDELPRDRNARAKELLARRREQAAQAMPAGTGLLPGEMVDDALARLTSGVAKWARRNFATLQWVILAGLLATGGFLFYSWRAEQKAGAASAALADAVSADRGRVMAEDKRPDEEKELDPTRIFKTAEERAEAALAGYRKVAAEHPGTGASMLAKLGEAGALLAKKDYDGALGAYQAVLGSPLAAADADVKGRAIEGIGFAKEAKGDLDGALASFQELERIDAKGYKELGQYQQARILIAKGDREKAKELLKAAHEKLTAPSTEGKHPFQFLEAVVYEALRKVDPSAAPPRLQLGGAKGQTMTPEQLEKLIKMTRQAAEKKAGEQEPH